MKLVIVSDLHIGKPAWRDYGSEMLDKALSMLDQEDILVLNGDITELNEETSQSALWDVLGRILAGTRHCRNRPLYNIGNKELQFVRSPLSQWRVELGDMFSDFGIQLAEDRTYTFDAGDREVSLVGTIGWCDGSFWQGQDDVDSEFPTTLQGVREAALKHYPMVYPTWNYDSCAEFYEETFAGLVQRAAECSGREWYLFSHFVTDRRFVIDKSAKFRYLNYFMGWDGDSLISEHKPTGVFVGHTHRSGLVEQAGVPVRNVSGAKEPFVLYI